MARVRKFSHAVLLLALGSITSSAQTEAFKPARTSYGKPDFNGIWQSMTTANWDIQGHAAQASHIVAEGARGAEPGGLGIVVGEEIPYLPSALAQKKANWEKRFTDDPEIKCYMPGVPRATYMPFPLRIAQAQDVIIIAYEFANAARTIYMDHGPPAPADSWMGHSIGRWEGDTLVVDVTSMNDETWFDRAGNYHSDALHVIERYTLVGPGQLTYEATIEDPNVFSRPWKISLPLYRHIEKDAQLVEFRCTEFVEELLYGPFRRQPK